MRTHPLGATPPPRSVCIVQAVMKRYRTPLFELMEQALAADNISLQVVYGPPWPQEAIRGDNVELAPPLGRKVANWWLGPILAQPMWKPWSSADLVIVEHANKYVLNYLLMALRALGLKRFAYWGHGRDRQSSPDSRSARLRRWTLPRTDWWFAYTEGARRDVEAAGFAADRITVVGNAIDTRQIRDQVAAVTQAQRDAARASLGMDAAARVLVCCGSLHPNKHVDLLVQASDVIHAADPSVHLVIIGGGPCLPQVRELAASRPWVHCVGPKFGQELAVLLSLAELWLNPGLVGLGVLDAFCAGLPMITRDLPVHSPEVEYIEHEINGLILPPDMNAYARTVVALLGDADRLRRMQDAARAASARHSIEAMATNFANGIRACLSSPS